MQATWTKRSELTQDYAPAADPSAESGHFGLLTSHDNEGSGGAETNVGVSEAEVLELTQRWTELRTRESFHLLSLERAVHQVRVEAMEANEWILS